MWRAGGCLLWWCVGPPSVAQKDGTCAAHPLFARVPAAENAADPAVAVMVGKTEEGIKVARQGGHNKRGEKYYAVWRRLPDAEALFDEAGAAAAGGGAAGAAEAMFFDGGDGGSSS